MKKSLILAVSLLLLNNITNVMPTKNIDPNDWRKLSSMLSSCSQILTKDEILESQWDATSGELMADWLQKWDDFIDQD